MAPSLGGWHSMFYLGESPIPSPGRESVNLNRMNLKIDIDCDERSS
jgi:hypothetical protein